MKRIGRAVTFVLAGVGGGLVAAEGFGWSALVGVAVALVIAQLVFPEVNV